MPGERAAGGAVGDDALGIPDAARPAVVLVHRQGPPHVRHATHSVFPVDLWRPHVAIVIRWRCPEASDAGGRGMGHGAVTRTGYRDRDMGRRVQG